MSTHAYLLRLGHALNFAADDKAAQRLRASLGLLRRNLRHHFGDQVESVFPFGSNERKTMLSHAADPERDIDVMVVFADKALNPETAIERLRPFMQSAYGRSDFGRDAPAFALRMQHIRLEVVPAVRRGVGHFAIPDTVSEHRNWISTFPGGFATALDRACEQTPHLRQVIRMVKYWNVRAGRPFASFSLEKQLVEAGGTAWPEGTRLPLTRSLIRAADQLSPSYKDCQEARRALGTFKDAMKEVAYLTFLNRHQEAREVLEGLLPPLWPASRQTPPGRTGI